MAGSTGSDLFEREEETAILERALQRAAAGRGGVTLIEGSSGIGKTALLDTARQRAGHHGARVLAARAGELEEDFAFGVVRQLFERPVAGAPAEVRERWLAGAASLAAPLFDPAGLGGEAGAETSYRLLHGLYWLATNMADDAPLLVVVDDAHWADGPSLRFLAFLAARIDELPVALVVGARPGRAEVGELGLQPGATTCRPRPLSPAALSTWLTGSLGSAPAPSFTEACRHASGGNPMLVRELVREVAVEAIAPDAGNAGMVASLSPAGVATSVLLRLGRLGPDATALAEAIAVLEDTDLAEAGALSGLAPEVARRALALLVEADLVAWDSEVRYVHPLVRSVVYQQLAQGRRDELHDGAAKVLAGRKAPPARIASQVLLTQAPAPWAVDSLCAAAAEAMVLGSPAAAAGWLARAAEEARGPARASVLLDLGRAQAAMGSEAAAASLRRAAEATSDPSERLAAVVALAQVQRYSGQGLAAVESLLDAARTAAAEGADPGDLLDVELLGCASLSIAARRRLAGWRAERLTEPDRPPATAWELLSVANLALDGSLDGRPAAEVADLAARATAVPAGVGERVVSQALSMAGLAFLLVDRFDTAGALFDGLVERTAARGLAGAHAGMLAQRASLHLRLGRLEDARAEAARALELGAQVDGGRTLLPRAAAVLLSVAAEQGREPPSHLVTDDIDPDSVAFRLLAHARAELALTQGHHAAAAKALLAYGRLNRELGWNGTATAWRSQAATALACLGEHDQAALLVEEELHLAERAGAPRAIGVALRASGALATGDRRRTQLAAAVDALAESPAVLDRAWALHDYGRQRQRDGDAKVARSLLAEAHRLAGACSATRLAALAAAALRDAGGRPRRGPASTLTAAEQRVADLAAAGHSNRAIAQTLFVTEKTVETHLAHAYRKLGIRSRAELAAVAQDRR